MTTNTTTSNKFYVYGHYRADTDELFYIGKGHGNRAWEKKLSSGRSEWWQRIVNKHGYTVKLLHEQLTEKDALKKERELIQTYGRQNISTGILINLTDGGEGGLNISDETRKKRSESVKKTTDGETYRKQLSERVKRQWDADPERKKKTSEAVKARLSSEEARQKLSTRVKNQWDNDPERKKKASAFMKATKRGLNQKEYSFIAPDGTIHHIRGLADFCELHGLNNGNMSRVHSGNAIAKSHKGWRKYIPPDNNHLINQFTL